MVLDRRMPVPLPQVIQRGTFAQWARWNIAYHCMPCTEANWVLPKIVRLLRITLPIGFIRSRRTIVPIYRTGTGKLMLPHGWGGNSLRIAFGMRKKMPRQNVRELMP